MVFARPLSISEAGYLALEEAETEQRHELWDGELVAMAGTSPEHNQLVFGLRVWLAERAAAGECRVFSETIRVRLTSGRYVYPDVVVACPPEWRDEPRPPTLLNPSLVAEVLSPSTSDYDRGRKLRGYQAVRTVEQVLLVDSESRLAEHHVRQDGGGWLYREHAGGTVELAGDWGALDLDPIFDAAGVGT